MSARDLGTIILIALVAIAVVMFVSIWRYRFRSLKKEPLEAPAVVRGSPLAWMFLGMMALLTRVGSGLYHGKPWYSGLLPVPSPEGRLSTSDNLFLLLGYSLLVVALIVAIREVRDRMAGRDDDGPP